MADVATNYRIILERIGEAAAKAGRRAEEVRLLGAAKSQSIDAVRAAIAAGIRLIGENYVQEAQHKKDHTRGVVEWHMIGHLQRNKAKAAVAIFDMIQSLDSIALARALDKEGQKRGVPVRALLEVNLGGETSKSGLAESKVEELVRAAMDLPNLRIEGLMAVPPFCENPMNARPYFKRLRELRDELREAVGNVDLQELSMGMTHDYNVAVEEGATIVRIGTALFGPRLR
jgi:pyridoxal phosphate enzyme (YggS family)